MLCNVALILLVTVCQHLHRVEGYNYCHNKSHVCDASNMKHFICRLDSEFKSLHNTAQLVGILPETSRLKELVLKLHNRNRNLLASGDLSNSNNVSYASASRMRVLIWDVELAYTARVHASTVSFQHSECRAVNRFPHAGENLGLIGISSDVRTIDEILRATFDRMFLEYLDIEDPKTMQTGYEPTGEDTAGHFTVMANERVSRVGCAVAIGTHCSPEAKDKGFCQFITCHYDFTNFADSYTYKSGEPASDCALWNSVRSKEYEFLCENTGEDFPRDHGED